VGLSNTQSCAADSMPSHCSFGNRFVTGIHLKIGVEKIFEYHECTSLNVRASASRCVCEEVGRVCVLVLI
jgi:hypothetical protein